MSASLEYSVGNNSLNGTWCMVLDADQRKNHSSYPPPTSAPHKRLHRAFTSSCTACFSIPSKICDTAIKTRYSTSSGPHGPLPIPLTSFTQKYPGPPLVAEQMSPPPGSILGGGEHPMASSQPATYCDVSVDLCGRVFPIQVPRGRETQRALLGTAPNGGSKASPANGLRITTRRCAWRRLSPDLISLIRG